MINNITLDIIKPMIRHVNIRKQNKYFAQFSLLDLQTEYIHAVDNNEIYGCCFDDIIYINLRAIHDNESNHQPRFNDLDFIGRVVTVINHESMHASLCDIGERRASVMFDWNHLSYDLEYLGYV